MSVNVNDEIPQWAKERACQLIKDEGGISTVERVCSLFSSRALARYIAQHEQPPVDPDLVKAREICARVADELAKYGSLKKGWAADYRSGDYDDDPEVQFALSALKEARNGK